MDCQCGDWPPHPCTRTCDTIEQWIAHPLIAGWCPHPTRTSHNRRYSDAQHTAMRGRVATPTQSHVHETMCLIQCFLPTPSLFGLAWSSPEQALPPWQARKTRKQPWAPLPCRAPGAAGCHWPLTSAQDSCTRMYNTCHGERMNCDAEHVHNAFATQQVFVLMHC